MENQGQACALSSFSLVLLTAIKIRIFVKSIEEKARPWAAPSICSVLLSPSYFPSPLAPFLLAFFTVALAIDERRDADDCELNKRDIRGCGRR